MKPPGNDRPLCHACRVYTDTANRYRFLNGNRIVTFSFRRRRSQRSDSASSLISEVEAGRSVALALPMLKLVAGKRLLYRPLTGTSEVAAGRRRPCDKGQ